MSILNDQQKAMIRTQYKPKQKRIEKENINGFLFDKVSYKEIQENRKNGVKESIIERQFKDLKDQDYLRANQIPEQIIEKDLIDSDSEENNLIDDNESENLIKSDDKNKYSTIKKKQLEIIKEEDEEDKKIDEKNLIDNDSKENNLIDKNKDLLENQLIDSKNSSQNNEQEQSEEEEEEDCNELIKEWLDKNNNNKFKEKINHIYSRLIEQEKKFKEYIDEKKNRIKKIKENIEANKYKTTKEQYDKQIRELETAKEYLDFSEKTIKVEIEKIKNNIAYVCQEEKTSSIEQIEKFITEEITAITKLNLNIKEKQRILDKHITESNINKDLILEEKEAQDIEEEADNDEIIQDFINENKEKKEKQDLVEKIKNTYEKLNNATSALKQCIEQANYEENEIIKKQINIFIDKNIGPIKNKERYIKEELAAICNIYSDPDSTKDEEQRGKTYISELKLNNQAFASLVLDFKNNIDTIIDFRNRQIPIDKNHGTKGCIYYDRENHEFYQILPDGNFYLHKITPLDEINNFISVAECHKVAPFQNIRLKQRLGLKTKYNKENAPVIKYKDDRRLFDYGENGPVINIDYFSGINCIDKDISQLHDNTFVNNATFNYNKDYLITKLKVGIQITTNMNRLYYHKPTKIFRDGKIIKCQIARNDKFSLKYLYLEDSGDVIAVDKNNNRQIIKKNKYYEHQEQNFKPIFYKIDKDNGLYCIDGNNNNNKTNINEKNIFIPTDNININIKYNKDKNKIIITRRKINYHFDKANITDFADSKAQSIYSTYDTEKQIDKQIECDEFEIFEEANYLKIKEDNKEYFLDLTTGLKYDICKKDFNVKEEYEKIKKLKESLLQFKNINNTLSEQKKNTNITDVIYDTIIDSINKISSKIANQVNKIKNIKHNGKTITLIQQNTLENNKKIKIDDYDKIIKEVLNEIFVVKDKEKKQNKNQQEDIDTTQLIDKNDDNDSNISDKKEKKDSKKNSLIKSDDIDEKNLYIIDKIINFSNKNKISNDLIDNGVFDANTIIGQIFQENSNIQEEYMECLKYYIDTLLKINVFKLDVISNKIEEFKNNFMSIFRKSKMPKPNNNLTYFDYVKQQILEVDEDNEVQNEEELSEDENKKDKDKKNLKKNTKQNNNVNENEDENEEKYDTKIEIKRMMNTKEFKEAFDMIFSEILFNPLFLSNEEDKNNFDPTLSVLKDPICKLILRFEKTNKNEKLIKLSNAAILITKFLIKNDKKTSKNNILTKIKDKLDQNSTLSIFINNIDGNVYKLLKTLEMYGLIKDIKFNYKKLKKVYLGGKEWMFFERTGNVDYLQPRVILTEEAKKLKAQLIINLCGDFITKHPNSLQCCDIIRDLLKQLDIKQDKLNIYNEKLKILSYYDIGYGNEIKKMHADNCIDCPNTLFDGNYGDYGIDTKETFDKKRYRYSAVNIAKQQVETLLDFSYRKTIKDNKINKGINTEESSKLLDRYNNDKTKLSDSFISFDNNDILSTNKFDKKYVKNVDENEYIILEKHNDLINSICDKTKNINKKNINITQIPTSFYNEEIKYQHDNIPADKNKTSTTNYSASIKEGDNEILDENAGALSQNEVKQEEDTLIKTKSKFSELVIVNEKSNKHRFDTLKQDNSNILEVLFYTRQDDTLPFIFQNYTNLPEVNLPTNSNECVAILNNQDNYKKIFCLDQACLNQSKKRQIIDIDIKKKEKVGQHILMTEKEHKEILPKIKQKFCQNFNEFLGISNVIVNMNTILETIFLKSKNTYDGTLESFNYNNIERSKVELMGAFIDKIEYNEEKDLVKIKMKYYDDNKQEKTFEVESDFSIPLDACTPSAKNYFNRCNDKIKDILNNIKIAKPKYKINQKIEDYRFEHKYNNVQKYTNIDYKYVFNSTATPLNEIVEEKETLSKFHNFCFDKFKTDIEHEVGSFGLDKYFKDKKKEYEELIDKGNEDDKKSLIDNNIKENKKENYNIIKSFEDENKRLNNIHQIQKIMEQAKAKNIQEQIKNKQLSTKGIDKEEQIKYDQNIISSYEQIKRQEINKNNLKNYLQNFLDEHKEDKKILQPVQDQVDKIKTEQWNKYKRSQSLIVDTGIKDKNLMKDKLNICNYFAKQMLSEKELNSNDSMKQMAKQKINDLVYSTDKLKKRKTLTDRDISSIQSKISGVKQSIINASLISKDSLTKDDLDASFNEDIKYINEKISNNKNINSNDPKYSSDSNLLFYFNNYVYNREIERVKYNYFNKNIHLDDKTALCGFAHTKEYMCEKAVKIVQYLTQNFNRYLFIEQIHIAEQRLNAEISRFVSAKQPNRLSIILYLQKEIKNAIFKTTQKAYEVFLAREKYKNQQTTYQDMATRAHYLKPTKFSNNTKKFIDNYNKTQDKLFSSNSNTFFSKKLKKTNNEKIKLSSINNTKYTNKNETTKNKYYNNKNTNIFNNTMYQQYRNKRNLKTINTKNIGLQNTKKIETSK